MPDLKGIVKGGWHPEKDGTTIKSQVKSLVGRKDDNYRRYDNHVSQPLSALKDPASFGPPPKHVGTGGFGGITPAAPGANQTQSVMPLRETTGAAAQHHQQPATEEDKAPPQPYRVDTTGLSTSNLPPPPVRRGGADGRSPPPQLPASAARPPPPNLPPRLPPRAGSGAPVTPSSTVTATASAPSWLPNQGALNRLGAAGVSVPALGIGRGATPPAPQRPAAGSPPPPPRSPAGNSQLGELQSRFARLGTPSGSAVSPAAVPMEGTTLAQKQAALQTASAFRRDPTSVSVSDARAATSTFNNFRQRHGDQVAAGARQASALNERYGVADRFGGVVRGSEAGVGAGAGAAEQTSPMSGSASLASAVSMLGKKQPAPPPPKKKPELSSGGNAPPPLPLGTKPQF